MSLIDTRTTRVLVTVSVFAIAVGFLYVARHTLVAFLFAIFFAYLVDPAVSRVEKWTKGRGRAIAIIYLLIVAFMAVFFFFVGPRIGHEAQKLTESLPKLFDRVTSGQLVDQFGTKYHLSPTTLEQLKGYITAHGGDLLKLVQSAGLRAAEVAQQSWLVILVPILAAFFLKDGRAFSRGALALVHTKPQREFLQGVIGDMNQMLAEFIRAQLTLALLTWVAYASVLGLMNVPYALMLGTVGGILEFISVVGPLVASLLIMGVAVLTGYPHWLIVLAFLGAWRLLQDYFVSPRIFSRSVELHPLAAIFGVLAGVEIAGVLGVYLSIPIMASLRIVWRRWRMFAEKKRFGPLSEYSFLNETTSRK